MGLGSIFRGIGKIFRKVVKVVKKIALPAILIGGLMLAAPAILPALGMGGAAAGATMGKAAIGGAATGGLGGLGSGLASAGSGLWGAISGLFGGGAAAAPGVAAVQGATSQIMAGAGMAAPAAGGGLGGFLTNAMSSPLLGQMVTGWGEGRAADIDAQAKLEEEQRLRDSYEGVGEAMLVGEGGLGQAVPASFRRRPGAASPANAGPSGPSYVYDPVTKRVVWA